MKKMKIAIVTMFYNNMNYGAQLQAFALTKILEKIHFSSEQIQCDIKRKKISSTSKMRKIKNFIKNIYFLRNFAVNLSLKKRKTNFKNFIDTHTPCSKIVFDETNISNCLNDYDVFICGSDQVWNPEWWNKVYLLNFVPKEKKKISFAASVSKTKLTEEELETLSISLENYSAISVREKNTALLLSKLLSRPVEWVLDPTLLLEKTEWELMCTEKKIKKDYIFYYFIGNNPAAKKVAEDFAKKKNLKIVWIPFVGSSGRAKDFFWGDKRFYSASPIDFLSLIKHASYVFTDSFHCSVFSIHFKTQFFVFGRLDYPEMSVRLLTLLELFNVENRLLVKLEEQTTTHIDSMEDIVFCNEYPEFNTAKVNSINFLKDNLKEFDA